MKKNKILYFNSAATKQMPLCVQEVFTNALNTNINSNRSNFSNNNLFDLKSTLASFFGSNAQNYHFLGNSTIIANYVAELLFHNNYLLNGFYYSDIDHHSLFAPFLIRAKGIKLKLNSNYDYDLKQNWQKIDVLLLTLADNLRCSLQNLKPLITAYKQVNPSGIVIIDVCQAIVNYPVNFEDLNCDFAFFSLHKMYGPLGCGILYISKIEQFPLVSIGGGNCSIHNGVLQVSSNLEIGTLNYPSIVASKRALEYFKSVQNFAYLFKIKQYFVNNLNALNENYYFICEHNKNLSVLIQHKIVHAHDLMTFLAQHNVIVRAGEMCNSNFINLLKTANLVRISFDFHTTYQEIDRLIQILNMPANTMLDQALPF